MTTGFQRHFGEQFLCILTVKHMISSYQNFFPSVCFETWSSFPVDIIREFCKKFCQMDVKRSIVFDHPYSSSFPPDNGIPVKGRFLISPVCVFSCNFGLNVLSQISAEFLRRSSFRSWLQCKPSKRSLWVYNSLSMDELSQTISSLQQGEKGSYLKFWYH